MKKLIATLAIILLGLSMSGCATKTGGTVLGGVAGAGLGAAVTNGSPWGVGIGAVGGAVAGNALSR